LLKEKTGRGGSGANGGGTPLNMGEKKGFGLHHPQCFKRKGTSRGSLRKESKVESRVKKFLAAQVVFRNVTKRGGPRKEPVVIENGGDGGENSEASLNRNLTVFEREKKTKRGGGI